METAFDFRDLFVLDLANNHQGSVEHGKKIIQAMSEVCNKHGVRAAIKFQFRQLDTFIHPDHQQGSELKYIQRFQSTRMERDEFEAMLDEICSRGPARRVHTLRRGVGRRHRRNGLRHPQGGELLGEGLAPARRRSPTPGKPVICSTGGLAIEDIDNVVSFFQHRAVHFALMHCVSIYPTPDEKLALNQIRAHARALPGRRDRLVDPRRPGRHRAGGHGAGAGAEHVRAPRRRRHRRDRAQRLLVDTRSS